MKFERPTVTGTIQNRYKRFFADLHLDDGRRVKAHVPNTGSMKTCFTPGQRVLATYHDGPKRKLPYTLEMIHNGKNWIGINTSRPNKMAKEAIADGIIRELVGYDTIKTECVVGASRIDILLENGAPKNSKCYVEIKNVTLREKNKATFPDAVTARGQKHLRELMNLLKQGHRAVMLFVVQRRDVQSFSPADTIDPCYGKLLREASDLGVELLAYRCSLSTKGIWIKDPLPIQL